MIPDPIIEVLPRSGEPVLIFWKRVSHGLYRHQKAVGRTDSRVRYPVRLLVEELDWPYYWREEVEGPNVTGNQRIEYLIRYARSIGLHVSYDAIADHLVVRLTRDVEDEQTIDWPGKSRERVQ